MSSSKALSCGLLVISPAGWLLAHATRTPRWDLPKGGIEVGETPLQAALRECQEETGLDLGYLHNRIRDHGRHPYIPKKDLHLFSVRVEEPLDLSVCSCSTMIEREGGSYPETDRWEWTPKTLARERLGAGMVRYLERAGFLESTEEHKRGPKP